MGRRGGAGGRQTSRCTKPGAAAAPWRARDPPRFGLCAAEERERGAPGREVGGPGEAAATQRDGWNGKAREDGYLRPGPRTVHDLNVCVCLHSPANDV
jgi:hypothetical protein